MDRPSGLETRITLDLAHTIWPIRFGPYDLAHTIWQRSGSWGILTRSLEDQIKGEPPCHYQSERCPARAHVLVAANGRQLLQPQLTAASANSQSCSMLHAQPAAHITAVKFSRSSPDAGFNRKARSFGKSRASQSRAYS
jgi:hypothetical protein